MAARGTVVPRRLAVVAATGSGVIMVGLLGITVTNIVARRWLGWSVPGALEYTEVVLAGLVMLGLAHAEYDGAHVRTTLLTSRLPAGRARATRLAGVAVSTAFLAIMLWALVEKTLAAYAVREFRIGVAEVQIWPFRIVAAVGVALLVIAHLDHRVRTSHPSAEAGEGTPHLDREQVGAQP